MSPPLREKKMWLWRKRIRFEKWGAQIDTINTFFSPSKAPLSLTLDQIHYINPRLTFIRNILLKCLSCQQIADNAACARTSVLKFLKEYGFETNKPGSNRNRKRGPTF